MRHGLLYRWFRVFRGIQLSISKMFLPVSGGWGSFGENSYVNPPFSVSKKNNLYIGEDVRIMDHCQILNEKGRCVFGNYSGAAAGLTVVTDNHAPEIGSKYSKDVNDNLIAGEVVIGEDVWIGINVTLLANVHIGRGAIIGAGSVLRDQTIPPYAIVVGNPAKVIGFRFTPSEALLHEESLYPLEERMTLEELERNYDKYFITNIKKIKQSLKL